MTSGKHGHLASTLPRKLPKEGNALGGEGAGSVLQQASQGLPETAPQRTGSPALFASMTCSHLLSYNRLDGEEPDSLPDALRLPLLDSDLSFSRQRRPGM